MNSRPTDNPGDTSRIKTGCGWLYITVCPGDYKEVFFKLGKTGNCPASFLQALATTVSLAWRAGVPLKKIMGNFQGVGCPNPMWYEGIHVLSCADGIAHVLKPYCEEE
jgi:hypothetical protein